MYNSMPLAELPHDHPCAAGDIGVRTFCAALDPKELERFRCQASVVHFRARQPLFHEGDVADCIYSLTRGMVQLYKLLPDGRRQVIGFLQAGDFLGITIDDEYAFSSEAVEPVELCRFSRSRFDAFIEEHPKMERALYRLAAHELSLAQQQLVLLGRKTAPERIASFLLMLRKAANQRTDFSDTVRLPMNRLDIADYLGLTKETVSRIFTSFKTTGVIRLLADDTVRLLKPQLLEEFARGG